jgi:hypothetical protein
MPETLTPAEFSPSFDAQAAQRNQQGHLIPRVAPTIPGLLFAEALPTSTTYVDVVAAPGAGKKIRIHALCYSNAEAAAKGVRVRFGASAAMFTVGMPATTGYVALPIPAGGYIEGAANEAFQASLVASTAADTRAMALYTIVDA